MINLYKNGILELTLDGKIENNVFISNNLIYDLEKKTLSRNQDGYKLSLDFSNNEGFIELTDYGQSLPIKIEIVEIIVNDKSHNVKYKIESEEDILNELEVIF